MTKSNPFGRATQKKEHQENIPELSNIIVDEDLTRLDIDYIDPDPEQPRKAFNNIDELAESCVLTDGCQQPIKVRPHPAEKGRYMLISGERRLKAHQYAVKELQADRLQHIKAIVKRNNDEIKQVRLEQTIENMARADMTRLEEAQALRDLIDTHDMKKGEAAKATNRRPSEVSRLLAIVDDAPERIQQVATKVRNLNSINTLIKIALLVDETETERYCVAVEKQEITEKELSNIYRQLQCGEKPDDIDAKNSADTNSRSDSSTDTSYQGDEESDTSNHYHDYDQDSDDGDDGDDGDDESGANETTTPDKKNKEKAASLPKGDLLFVADSFEVKETPDGKWIDLETETENGQIVRMGIDAEMAKLIVEALNE
jgi:ParB/RepB/Spo0J family partition protein